MWYRFTFAADYQGRPFKIDQMVNCTRSVISGGSLGQSPDAYINEAHPMTVAAKMHDGSQVLVRVPDMCKRYRKFDKREGRFGYRTGWKSEGVQPVTPLVIWSDKMPRPDRIESYVALDYYKDARARLKNPSGAVDLWPAGRYPDNFAAVLEQEDALPFYPNPWVNPDRDPNGRGKGRDGRYHGEPQRFAAFFSVPVVNEKQWREKYEPIARAAPLSPILVDGTDAILRPTRSQSKEIVADPESGNPLFYRVRELDDSYALKAEPQFVTAQCVSKSISKLMGGAPGMSDLPFDAGDTGTSWPDEVRNGLTGLNASVNQLDRKTLAGLQERSRNCYSRLGQLLSFDISNGRLDTSAVIPGALVYHRWYEDKLKNELDVADELKATGAVDGMDIKFRDRGSRFQLPLFGRDGRASPSIVYENSASGSWVLVYFTTYFFGGKKENSHI